MHTLSKLFGATALLAVSLAPQASSVFYSVDSGKLIGLDGLVVDGGIYNVSFVSGPYSSLSGSYIFQTDSGATDAASAILAALNDPNATPAGVQSDASKVFGLTYPVISDPVNGDYRFSVIFAPGVFGFNDGTRNVYVQDAAIWSTDGYWVNATTSSSSVAGFDSTNQPTFVWAKFTPTPIPAAIWMVGSALVGLIGLGRRKLPA